MALAFNWDEMVEDVGVVFWTLCRELSDEYIVVDYTYSENEMMNRDGVSYCAPIWSVLVLGPGMITLVSVEKWATFVQIENNGECARLTYLDQYGEKRTYPPHTLWISLKDSSSRKTVEMEKIVEAIAEFEDTSPETSDFFAHLRIERMTVLPFASYEWDPKIGRSMGYNRLYTLKQAISKLREMENTVPFSTRNWDKSKVETLLETMEVDLHSYQWEKVKEQKHLHSQIPKFAAVSSDEALQEKIAATFPFPLAFSLRVALTSRDPAVDYTEKLRCGENLLAYLGSLGIMLAQAAGLSLETEEDIKVDLLQCWSRGTSAGHWAKIIRETTRALHKQDHSASLPVSEFSSIWWRRRGSKLKESELASNLDALVKHRNDFHHQRGPNTPQELEEASVELQKTLLEILRGLNFLTQYPLWYVKDCAAQRGSNSLKVTYKLCVGDHPKFTQLEAEYATILVRDSLYLKSGEQLYDLTPWIVIRQCPVCKDEAVFFIEKIDAKKRSITFKSFERGHTDKDEELWDSLARPLGLQQL